MAFLNFQSFKQRFLRPIKGLWYRLFIGFLTALVCALYMSPGVASEGQRAIPLAETRVQQSRILFETGHYSDAIQQLQQASEHYQTTGDNLNQALALRNLAFVYQQLGQWTEARATIATGLAVIEQLPAAERPPILARILDIQGHLYLNQGQAPEALQVWQSSAHIYESLGDENRHLRAILTQAQALQAMGHYRRAIDTLKDLVETLASQPDSELKATGLQLLGEAWRIAGDLEQANITLETSLDMAQRLNLSPLISTIQVSLGNTAQTLGELETAQHYYRQASTQTEKPMTAIQAQLSELTILVDTQQWQRAESLVRQIQPLLDRLPPSQAVIYAKINLAENQLKISQRNARLEKTPRRTGTDDVTTLPSTYTRNNLDLVNLLINRDTTVPSTPPSTINSRTRADLDALTYTRDNINLVEQFLGGQVSAAPSRPRPSTLTTDADTYTRNNTNLIDIFLGRFDSSPQTAPVVETPVGRNLSASAQTEIEQLLQQAQKDAKTLGDLRSESYVLGSLGHLYEQAQQWPAAETFTQKALLISQSLNAPEISYRWQWQLGRIFKATLPKAKDYQAPNYIQAVKAYSAAVQTLQSLRHDLASINPEVQVAFQAGVEPIHRELVSLLLADKMAPPENLEKARNVIESLQLAELDNFFREACISANPVLIDQVDRQAAIVYPILLPDRLDVIVRLPGQPLRHYSSSVSQTQLETTVQQLRQALVQRSSQRYLPLAQQVYDWLVRPLVADLTSSDSDVKTLVFVSDGILRNVPMAALHDGNHYLMEHYAIALTPGLQLLEPTAITDQNLAVLIAGLTEARQNFPSLPNVGPEIDAIEARLSAQKTLLNQEFTREAFTKAIRKVNAPVIHLATHGQFSSNFDETFILTWNDRLSVHQLRDLLQTTGLDQTASNVVELLVLSACETAMGDQQAALGLAGTAVRSGARSTLGSLWQVSDEATALLISRFYSELATGSVTKAEALRRAQLSILEIPRFRQHPFFWAPYILVGNWL